MNSSINKDESILHLNNEELEIKKRRKTSNVNVRNTFKTTSICKKPIKVSNSISKFRLKNKNRDSLKQLENSNIINDYLHRHKFGIQRKISKKITVKVLKTNMNKSLLANKYSNINTHECASMIYYPNSDKTKKMKYKEDIKDIKDIKIEKDKKPNLKKIEDSLKNKLYNMKFNFLNESTDEIFNIKNNRDNNKSVRIIKKKRMSNSHLNNIKRRYTNHITKFNGKRSNNNQSNTNNLNKSSNFASQNANTKSNSSFMTKLNKSSNEIKRISLEKINVTKDNIKLTDLDNNKSRKKDSALTNIVKQIQMEKARNLFRTNLVYDSFDDDESDKDEDSSSIIILPNSYIILILDYLIFLSTLYISFYLPLRMAKYDCFCIEEKKINKILLYLIDILYIIDFSICFFRAYYDYHLRLVKKNKKIILHYLGSDCLFDFLEAIPIFSYSHFLCTINKEVNYCFRYNMSNLLIFLRILTNLKIIKIFKVRNKQKNITFNSLLNLFYENYAFEKFLDNLIKFTTSFFDIFI